MALVLYALFYVFLVIFIFFDSFKQEFNKLELSGKEERKLVNGEDPLTRDFPDPLYEEFEESSSESSDVNFHQLNLSIPICFSFYFKLLLFVCCFSQVIDEVHDEFLKVIRLLTYGSDFMI